MTITEHLIRSIDATIITSISNAKYNPTTIMIYLNQVI